MHFPEIEKIPTEVWDKAVPIVLEQIRAEKGIPDWEPKLLNGSREFEERMLKFLKEEGLI